MPNSSDATVASCATTRYRPTGGNASIVARLTKTLWSWTTQKAVVTHSETRYLATAMLLQAAGCFTFGFASTAIRRISVFSVAAVAVMIGSTGAPQHG